MLTKIYLGLAIFALSFYAVTTFAGWEFGSTKLSASAPSASSSSGRSGGGFFFGGGGGGYGGGK